MHRRLRVAGPIAAIVLLATVAPIACTGEADSPEARVREALGSAQRAVVDQDLGVLTEMVSTRYADEAGRERRDIVGLLRRQFVESQAIHLLTRIQEVTVPEPGRAQATILVAAGATPPDEADLSSMRGDFYRFDLALAEEDGRWKVVRAAWQRMGSGGLM